ncbi:MAG: hypothetical protein JW866_02035, partial [Ignavibacteriales bacterium]|nr:hypothetical protein [Ignavibacteriales bacterium]
MKFKLILVLFIVIYSFVYSQAILTNDKDTFVKEKKILLAQEDIVLVPTQLKAKIFGSSLILKISEKNYLRGIGKLSESERRTDVVVYFKEEPTNSEISELEALGLRCYTELWTPPLPNHPYGYILASMPNDRLTDVLFLQNVKGLATSEHQNYPENNEGTRKIKADSLWLSGYTGTGVKVAVLDSG